MSSRIYCDTPKRPNNLVNCADYAVGGLDGWLHLTDLSLAVGHREKVGDLHFCSVTCLRDWVKAHTGDAALSFVNSTD